MQYCQNISNSIIKIHIAYELKDKLPPIQ
jgi:hypothetical protein